MYWITINEYSILKKVSISTIRRYIKKDKVVWKKESDGKYYIKLDSIDQVNNGEVFLDLKREIESLRQEQKKIISENNELKMLVNLYEKQIQDTNENFIGF